MDALNWIDWTIFYGSLAVVFALGVWFARRQHCNEEYFVGSRQMKSWAVGVSLFPFERELIILVTAWILLLPVALERKRAALGLFLLLTALGVIRLTGANSRDPSDVLVLWSLLHLPVAAVLQRCEPAKPDKHTVRSVS